VVINLNEGVLLMLSWGSSWASNALNHWNPAALIGFSANSAHIQVVDLDFDENFSDGEGLSSSFQSEMELAAEEQRFLFVSI